jgi:hypothetical protein
MMLRMRIILPALVLVATFVAACGGGKSAGPTAAPTVVASATTAAPTRVATATPSPEAPTPAAIVPIVGVQTCALLRVAELETIFHGDTFATDPGAEGTCGYIGDNGAVTDTIRITLTQQTAAVFKSIKGNSQGTQDVANIADQAYMVQDTATLVRLYLLKGTWSVGITLSSGGDTAAAKATPVAMRVAAIQSVGAAVAGRLP